MRVLRIVGALIGTIAIVGMFSCGGSSYLSEFPTEGENVSTATITAGGMTQSRPVSTTAKDALLDPVTGDATGSGDAFLDAGLHECSFEFEPVSKPDGDIVIKATAAECSGIVNCGYCEATQTGYPNCELNCIISTSASGDLVGEYIEIRYVDKAILYSDAAGSSGGALRIEGEALDPAVGSHLFDSTSRVFSIIDGGLTLDQVTPITDVNTGDKFDYTMAITDMVLDPSASAHNAAIPDNSAWVDIESRVTSQIPLDALAVPNSTVSLDAGTYASNLGFWHDAANEQDIMAFVQMFNAMLEFQDADILSYANCSTAWQTLDTDIMCIPIDTARTADGVPELLAMSVAAGSAFNAHSDITDSATCQALGGEVGTDIDPNLPPYCIPATIAHSVTDYPIGGASASAYSITDSYTVSNDGAGADMTTAQYAAAIFDPGTTENTLIDQDIDCEASFGDMRPVLKDVVFFGDINQASPDCMAVAQRFIDDPTLPIESRAQNGQFSIEIDTVNPNQYLQIFYDDFGVNIDHPMYGYLPDTRYGEHQLFWDQALGIERSTLDASILADGISTQDQLYARDGLTSVDADIMMGWVDQAIDKTGIGDGLDNDYIVKIELLQDSSANSCDDGNGPFGFYGIVVGNNPGTNSGCLGVNKYDRGDAYMLPNSFSYPIEETSAAAMSTMFQTAAEADALGAADWEATGEMTLFDMWQNCQTTASTHLYARPYYRNAIDLPTDPAIDDVCRDVAQRFVSTPISNLDVGTDKLLVPYGVTIEIANPGSSTPGGEQGFVIKIMDSTPFFNPVFEDISGTYIEGDFGWIPAYGITNGTSQWFQANDMRVQAPWNTVRNQAMSIHTQGGLAQDNYRRVSTFLELFRVRELDRRDPAHENVYLLTLDLMNPVADDGTLDPQSCNFYQTFVIDGTCESDNPFPQ